jgi:hypothetical protein
MFTADMKTAKGQTLTLSLDNSKAWNTAQMSGLLNATQTVAAQRNPFLNKNDPTSGAAFAALAPYIGYHTYAFTATLVPGSAGAALNTPAGHGWLTATVDKNGGVKLAGKLADGTAASASTTLLMGTGAAEINRFIPLYSARGFVSGWMELNAAGACVGGSWRWLYPGAKPAAKPPAVEDRFTVALAPAGGVFGPLANLGAYVGKHFKVASEGVDVVLQDAGKGAVKLPAAKPPVWDKTAGVYVFNPDNPAVATFSANAKTGLFTGKFNVYEDAGGKLKTISLSHAGILLRDGAVYIGKGYCLEPETWKSADPKPVGYTIKRSSPVVVE